MNKLSANLRTLLIMGVKRTGSYEVAEVFAAVEEAMTGAEAEASKAFLEWVVKTGNKFGHGNIDQRWAEWRASLGAPGKTVRKPSQNIHKALDLPSPYHVGVVVEGHISHSATNKPHYRLRIMHSPTGGAETVFAKSVSWGAWTEINKDEFNQLAKAILGLEELAPA